MKTTRLDFSFRRWWCTEENCLCSYMKRIRIREFETSQEEEIREEEGRIDSYRKEMRGRGRGKGWEGRQNVEKLKNREYNALYVTRTQNCVLY